jgi:hypothetical protein
MYIGRIPSGIRVAQVLFKKWISMTAACANVCDVCVVCVCVPCNAPCLVCKSDFQTHDGGGPSTIPRLWGPPTLRVYINKNGGWRGFALFFDLFLFLFVKVTTNILSKDISKKVSLPTESYVFPECSLRDKMKESLFLLA